MRNYLIFVLTLVLPLSFLAILIYEKWIDSELFIILILAYAFFYHPIVSVIRLISLNKIPRRELWLAFIPFWNWKYSSMAVFDIKG
jgi:hypothetical protein